MSVEKSLRTYSGYQDFMVLVSKTFTRWFEYLTFPMEIVERNKRVDLIKRCLLVDLSKPSFPRVK